MPKAVVRHGVAFCKFASCQFRMGRRVSADQKGGGEYAFPPERVEHRGCRAGARAVVERKHDLLVGEGQGRGKMLAADARCRGGVDPDEPLRWRARPGCRDRAAVWFELPEVGRQAGMLARRTSEWTFV